MTWEAVIGLEVHARLLTRTKMFCRCSAEYGAEPNSSVCPICLAYPGALPAVNGQAVRLALRMAAAVGSEIHLRSLFARKNYFYPDLPKGYQISQFDRPIATGGGVPIRSASGAKEIGLVRIHLEEDAGKLLHESALEGVPADVSLVDLNRAGSPLIEIVSLPEIRSAEEAVAYLTRLRQILMYTEVCDGNMEEGSLRCDANISVHRIGRPFGTRVEIKNLNSFRYVGRAIEHETARQIALIESGGIVAQETRSFDVASGETRPMRSKEEAHDYRYFSEPDLLPLEIDERWVEKARAEVPSLPDERIRRYQSELGVPVADAEVLVSSREIADYFEEVARISAEPRAAANWVRNEVLAVLKEKSWSLADFPLAAAELARLIVLIGSGAIGGKAAKEVFEELSVSGGSPDAVVERRGLGQISDPAAIREIAERVVNANAAQVEKYRGGKPALFGFFVGQVMKESGGRANAELANSILRELLDG
jgi:aspartyl-tRNA(Asn)/glutamyl-tRNA(Gln) amidotransferase subunit B